jgi:hypothetical protein
MTNRQALILAIILFLVLLVGASRYLSRERQHDAAPEGTPAPAAAPAR